MRLHTHALKRTTLQIVKFFHSPSALRVGEGGRGKGMGTGRNEGGNGEEGEGKGKEEEEEDGVGKRGGVGGGEGVEEWLCGILGRLLEGKGI